jgi:hypothetical protein
VLTSQQDLICMVAWENGEPEIKLGIKRENSKGMADNPKKEIKNFVSELGRHGAGFAQLCCAEG